MRPTVALLAVLALLISVPAAGATIVVQKSIAGVKLGIKEAQVRSILGKPAKVTDSKDKITGQKQRTLLYAGKSLVQVRLIGDLVMSVRTIGKTEKTSSGIGVGATETALKQKVKGVKCSTYKSGKVSYRICGIGKGLPGQIVTTFGISPKTKKIESISVDRVID